MTHSSQSSDKAKSSQAPLSGNLGRRPLRRKYTQLSVCVHNMRERIYCHHCTFYARSRICTERRSEQVVVFHLKRVVYPCCKFIRAREVSGVARTQIMQTNKPQRHFSKSAFDAGNFLLRPIPRAATFAPSTRFAFIGFCPWV